MARSNKKKKAAAASAEKSKALSAFQEMMQEQLDDDDENEDMAPESEWDDRTKALKAAIEGGLENALAVSKDDEGSSFEEDTLDDEEDSEIDDDDGGNTAQDEGKGSAEIEQEEDTVDGEESGDESVDAKGESKDTADDSDSDDEDEAPTVEQKNTISSKALRVVTKELQARKSGWDWAETFDVVPETPLPFGKETSVHDDLKREVAFYDVALEAVRVAKKKCEVAQIPFSRPDDFFAEMVKTDGE